tara:strand:+ start:26618 stop:27631 length:1014 start_codon:yes stop_codon:yes gene_type:complete
MRQKLIILFNEKIHDNNGIFSSDGKESKSLSEGLNKFFKIEILGRYSKTKNVHEISLNNVNIAKNIIFYLKFVIKNLFKNKKYLIVSITPFTFLSIFILILGGKKPYIYLRSDGFKEYHYKFGFLGRIAYGLMFYAVSWRCKLISCNQIILKKNKGTLVSPSQLTSKWFLNHKNISVSDIKLLYVGRLRVEKGIFDLVNILKDSQSKYNLTILSDSKNKNSFKFFNKVKIIEVDNKIDSIINTYDNHNIVVLPSFTEGHPQVLDEALARRRPVIIFEEISHVIGKRRGVFVAKRNYLDLERNIIYIKKNYEKIIEDIKKNSLPLKDTFLIKFKDAIN